jgi:hypothetical protein
MGLGKNSSQGFAPEGVETRGSENKAHMGEDGLPGQAVASLATVMMLGSQP